MRACVLAVSVVALTVVGGGQTTAEVRYPFAVTLDAQLKMGVTTVTSKVTITVDRAMDVPVRARVTDALKFGGYPNFLNTLRLVQSVGSIQTQSGRVDIRYTREEQDGAGTRLILVADRPLFFLGGDPAKRQAGFELTLADLRFDGQGGVTGQLTGAARVRPSPDGTVLLDTYAEEPAQLKGTLGKP